MEELDILDVEYDEADVEAMFELYGDIEPTDFPEDWVV